jgi:hypothetical protein
MRRAPLTDRFGALLTFVKAAFLFLSPEDALNSYQTAMKPPRSNQNFIFARSLRISLPAYVCKFFLWPFFSALPSKDGPVVVGQRKSRITPEPEQFESLPVPIHDGPDEIKNLI